MKPIVLDTQAMSDGSLRYRFTCPLCRVEGAWHESMSDAERSGARHNRTKHPVEVKA